MKKEICEIHHEPKNIISEVYGEICIKCYLEIIKKAEKRNNKINERILKGQLSIYDNRAV